MKKTLVCLLLSLTLTLSAIAAVFAVDYVDPQSIDKGQQSVTTIADYADPR